MSSRLLAVDIGNTEAKLGIFEDGKLLASWRVSTRRDATEDEWGMVLDGFFRMKGLEPQSVQSMILSSTVPPLIQVIEACARGHWNWKLLVVRPGIKTGMPILYDNPQDVGADRIVNGVAAVELYGAPAVVVDFGTATTFDCISANAEYLGGVIAPGIGISSDALFSRAARLTRVEIADPGMAVGRNTQTAIQSGLFHGYVGLVDGILGRVLEEMSAGSTDPNPARVVATGGYASLIAPGCARIESVDNDLTLQGLQIVWERNERK